MRKPQTQYAFVDDISIAYQVIGDGPIDLVYAQGWLTNIEYAWESPHYAEFLTKLSRFCRVLFFDKRGTGLSERNVGFPTLEQRTEDITAVLDAVGSEEAALLGVSEGGNMSALFAATYPERTRALVLSGTSAKGSWRRTILGVRSLKLWSKLLLICAKTGAWHSALMRRPQAWRTTGRHANGGAPICVTQRARKPLN